MTIEQLVAIGLTMLALILMGLALGASIMWRLVNLPKMPPPLPAWVHSLYLAATAAWFVAALIEQQWLLVAGAMLLSVTAIAQLVASSRARAEREQP